MSKPIKVIANEMNIVDGIIILIGKEIVSKINEDEHFFEKIGKKLDCDYERKGDNEL